MTPARKPFRSRWAPGFEEKPAPVDTRARRARSLPMFGPGIVISVPLHLWPEYAQIYRLEPCGIQEPKLQPKNGPGEGILLVKRVPKETNAH